MCLLSVVPPEEEYRWCVRYTSSACEFQRFITELKKRRRAETNAEVKAFLENRLARARTERAEAKAAAAALGLAPRPKVEGLGAPVMYRVQQSLRLAAATAWREAQDEGYDKMIPYAEKESGIK